MNRSLLGLLLVAGPLLAARAGAAGKIGIIPSIGDASARPEVIARMVAHGATAFRFNLAHKDKRLAQREAGAVRAALRPLGVAPRLLFDLPGGKVRTGAPPAGGAVELRPGSRFVLGYGRRAAPSTASYATVDHAQLGRFAAIGGRILLHQGKIELEITAVRPGEIETRVVRGGTLRGHATVDVAGQEPTFPAMTAQDRRKLAIAVASGATDIGVSMVQHAGQIQAVRRALVRLSARGVRIVAKIETRAALDHLDAIVAASDAVMIAGGDLATAVGSLKALLAAEQQIATAARRRSKPLIHATAFEGPDAKEAVARTRRLGSDFVVLKATAIEPDPVEHVARIAALLP
jgi:pyruvate kinase